MVSVLPKHHRSLTRRKLAEKKIYAIDHGLARAVLPLFGDEKGRMLKQVVMLELLRRGRSTYFYKNGFECDFVVDPGTKAMQAIQVCYNMADEDTKKRELRGLLAACDYFKLRKGLIITHDQADTINVGKVAVELIPVDRWLLE